MRQIRRVLVLGAGVAGLSAARALTRLGYEVIVLEARERVGGRCWTVDGIELGAQWIHSTEGNPLTTLARELGLSTLFVGGDSTYLGGWDQMRLLGAGGRELEPEEKLRSILTADVVRDALDALRRTRSNNGLVDLSLHSASEQVMTDLQLNEADRLCAAWHLTLLARDDCAADAADLSLLWWDDGYEVYGYGDSIFVDGYSAVVNALAAGLDIRLGHVVETVEYGSTTTGVKVSTASGTALHADAAIVTLPLGVLKSSTINWNPPLPEVKRAAIEHLGNGTLNKVVVRFEEAFWQRDQYIFGCTGRPVDVSPTCMLNLWKTHRVPALVMLVGGTLGRDIELWSDAELRRWTVQLLEDTFGVASEPLAIERTRWTADPFARGAYSYVAVGSTPADIAALADPVEDWLFFAGEATIRQYWATVHGAYVSGLREAARISGRLDIMPPRHFTENRRWREMTQRANRFFNMRGRALPRAELDDRLGVLRLSPVFAAVPPADLEVLATMFDVRAFAHGADICAAGAAATEMYIIVSGSARVAVAGQPRADLLQRGDAFGEYGLFMTGTRTASVRAEGPTVALVLDYQRFQRFLLAFPESMAALLRATVQRLVAHEIG